MGKQVDVLELLGEEEVRRCESAGMQFVKPESPRLMEAFEAVVESVGDALVGPLVDSWKS